MTSSGRDLIVVGRSVDWEAVGESDGEDDTCWIDEGHYTATTLATALHRIATSGDDWCGAAINAGAATIAGVDEDDEDARDAYYRGYAAGARRAAYERLEELREENRLDTV